MSPDLETMTAIAQVETRLASDIAATKEIARIAKHDVNNLSQAVFGIDNRLTKLQDKTEASFEKLSDKMAFEVRGLSAAIDNKFDTLASQIATINVQQGKSAGFYAGMAAVMTLVVTVIMGLAKVLFGGPA